MGKFAIPFFVSVLVLSILSVAFLCVLPLLDLVETHSGDAPLVMIRNNDQLSDDLVTQRGGVAIG